MDHKIMLPPGARGNISYIAPAGDYTINEELIEIEFQGQKRRYSMKQLWPVRSPRPVAQKMLADTPLLTGQRVLDALFPAVLGGEGRGGFYRGGGGIEEPPLCMPDQGSSFSSLHVEFKQQVWPVRSPRPLVVRTQQT